MKKHFLSNFHRKIFGTYFSNLNQFVIELNNLYELQKVFHWTEIPFLNDPTIYQFDYFEDVNERRVRDAESLGTVMRNIQPGIALEIGTSDGHSTALMADNAPNSKIFTVNIPPEEILSGGGGKLTTVALEKEKIGNYYRERKFNNIIQIFANTASWEPDIGTIDVAFIDGCHDSDFVYNDTRKILKSMKPGSFLLWHDFNLDLAKKYDWIQSVCEGVEWLYEDHLLKDRIFHIKDSWVGIHKV